MPRPLPTLLAVLFLLPSAVCRGEDVVEFLSGATSSGTVVRIEKEARRILFESNVGGRTLRRMYPYDKIHAVTYKDKRYVLNQMPADGQAADKPIVRSKQEVLERIDTIGRTPPDWYDATPLEYPPTLDLSWPKKPEGDWNNRKNVGQYLWDVINPNESKWRSGVRFIHHMVAHHKDDREKSRRAMRTLAGMYFRLFQDYARAAFWWHQGGVSGADREALAECYWRLGNRRMALDTLDQRRIRPATIKLLGDLGETRQALRLAEAYIAQVRQPQWGLLAAGDACRQDQQYRKAIGYYRRVLDGDRLRNEDYDRRARDRARQSIDAIRLFELLDVSQVEDGTYEAESMGYEGPIAVAVDVQAGRIENVRIMRHKEKQYYSALRDVPAQIVAKQSLKDVDATSRATITAEAVISATAKALAGDDGR